MVVHSGGIASYLSVYDGATVIVKSGGRVEEAWTSPNFTPTVEDGGYFGWE